MSKLLETDNIRDMYLWTKNKYKQNPYNIYLFNRYFNLCINGASDRKSDITVRSAYLKECDEILSIYCDYVILNECSISFIESQQNKILEVANDIISSYNI